MPKKSTNIYKRKDGRWEARYVKSVDAAGVKKYGSVYAKSYQEARERQLGENGVSFDYSFTLTGYSAMNIKPRSRIRSKKSI